MQRRDFLRQLGLAGIGLGWWGSGLAHAAEDAWASGFAAARRRESWLAGWESFDGEVLAERRLRWRGRPPRELAGTLYRNGPARFERGGQRYHHWFDGDGLVQAWHLDAQGVSHRARMVGTDKFRAEQRAGRFLRQAAGTRIEGAEPLRSVDGMNPANTSVLLLRDRLYALWEGGSAWELDAQDLQSKGPRLWREDLAGVPFSAHPLREADGSLWNVGLVAYAEKPALLIWRIGADGELVSITPLALDMPGYLHAFAMTPRHLVCVIAPWLYDRDGDGAYFERLRWQPERGSQAIVLDKNDLAAPRRHALPAGLAFHFGQAWEMRDSIELQACWTGDAVASGHFFSGVMRGDVQHLPRDRAALVQLSLPLAGSGDGSLRRLGPRDTEFPTWDTRDAAAAGRLYQVQRSARAPHFDSICAWDGRRERLDVHRYGEGWLAEEHLFVPQLSNAARDRGWLVGTALDCRRGRLCLSVFDAADLAAGPLCQAALPHALPLGFHGAFQRSG